MKSINSTYIFINGVGEMWLIFYFQNPLVVNTINSVLAISHALGTVRRELCSGKLHCLKHKYYFLLFHLFFLNTSNSDIL
jgi:hypothetical protein